MKLWYFEHCSEPAVIREATSELKQRVDRSMHTFEEGDVSDYVEYWSEYYPSETTVIEFLKTQEITKCGTNVTLGLDLFWVK